VQEPRDADLIRGSVDDPQLFEGVFERHYDAVRRYAQRRVGQAVGEELAARTFLVALERRSTFRADAESARGWLLGIATNLMRHHVRDEQTHLRILGALPPDRRERAPDDEGRLEALGVWPTIAEVLRTLPPGDRDAFVLAALEDLPYGEIAVALDIPVGTVRSRIHRVRSALRERLREVGAILGDDEWGNRRG
jgi:RNA polymerase sigma-70 factor (ECF subfamily)